MTDQQVANPVVTAAIREARKSLAALLLEIPEDVWRQHKGAFENAISAVVDERCKLLARISSAREQITPDGHCWVDGDWHRAESCLLCHVRAALDGEAS